MQKDIKGNSNGLSFFIHAKVQKTGVVPYFERNQLVAILRCKTMRYKSFSVLQLTSPVGTKGEHFIAPSADSVRKAIKTRRAMTSVVFMVIAANFAVEMVQDFTFATAVECIVSLVPAAWAWVSDWFSGWNLSTKTAVVHLLDKAKWCNRAVAWLDKYTPANEKKRSKTPLSIAGLPKIKTVSN